MEGGRPWDDLWWLFLYGLSKACVIGWVIISAGVTAGFVILFWQQTGRLWVAPILLIWFAVMGRIGLEWIRFYWAKVLTDERKHTSLEG